MKEIHIEEEFESSGLKCLVIFTSLGHRCGYVAVPADHPLYEKDDESSMNFNVHGGVTFTGRSVVAPNEWWIGFDTAHCDDGVDYDKALEYGLITRVDHRVLMSLKSHFHLAQRLEKRSLEYCMRQCEMLASQIVEFKVNKS